MFKITAEAFVSKFSRTNTAMVEGNPIKYINAQLGSKYTNPHTQAVSYDNLNIMLKGNIADAWEREIQTGNLVRVEGILHEKSYKNDTGVTIRYHEMTVHSFRPIEIRKKAVAPAQQADAPQAESQPSQAKTSALASLSPEQIGALSTEQLLALA